MAYTKANHGKMTFSSGGTGTSSHISCVMLNQIMGVTRHPRALPRRRPGVRGRDRRPHRLHLQLRLHRRGGGEGRARSRRSRCWRGERTPLPARAADRRRAGPEGFRRLGLERDPAAEERDAGDGGEDQRGGEQGARQPGAARRLDALGLIPATPERAAARSTCASYINAEIEKWAAPVKAERSERGMTAFLRCLLRRCLRAGLAPARHGPGVAAVDRRAGHGAVRRGRAGRRAGAADERAARRADQGHVHPGEPRRRRRHDRRPPSPRRRPTARALLFTTSSISIAPSALSEPAVRSAPAHGDQPDRRGADRARGARQQPDQDAGGVHRQGEGGAGPDHVRQRRRGLRQSSVRRTAQDARRDRPAARAVPRHGAGHDRALRRRHRLGVLLHHRGAGAGPRRPHPHPRRLLARAAARAAGRAFDRRAGPGLYDGQLVRPVRPPGCRPPSSRGSSRSSPPCAATL